VPGKTNTKAVSVRDGSRIGARARERKKKIELFYIM
jgi:hypothetical protein